MGIDQQQQHQQQPDESENIHLPLNRPIEQQQQQQQQQQPDEPEIIHLSLHRPPTNPLPILTPSSLLIVAPTMAGKTTFVKKLIQHRHKMFLPAPQSVHYAYSIWQQTFEDMEDVKFHRGLPTRDQLEANSILVLDDVMEEAGSSVDMMRLFTIDCHHKCITAIFLVQNLFHKSKYLRTISLNVGYIIIFGTKRDQMQIETLARQMFPGQTKFFMDSYRDSTNERYGYLLCDLHPATDRRFQLRTHIFPDERTWIYQPI